MAYLRITAALLALNVLFACAPQLQLPPVPQALIDEEREKQKELAFKLYMQRQERLFRVAAVLGTRGVDLCREFHLTYGVLWMHRDLLPEDVREVAARMLSLGTGIRAVSVAPGLPGEKAGLRPGDNVTKIAGKEVSNADEAVRLMREAGHGRVIFEGQRSGETFSVSVRPEPACSFSIHPVDHPSVNGFSDGQNIGIASGMIRFVNSDDELAIVIGHELAHNVLGHRKQGEMADALLGLPGVLLGGVIDIAAAAVGVDTGGVGARAGARAGTLMFSKQFEMEADHLGLTFAARAGFDVLQAPDFLRRMGIEHPGTIGNNFLATHPSFPERTAAMRESLRQIQEMMARRKKAKLAITDLVNTAYSKEGSPIFERFLKERLKWLGHSLVEEGEDLRIEVKLREFDPGSKALRLLIGFGAGRAVLNFHASFRDKSGSLIKELEGGRSYTGMELEMFKDLKENPAFKTDDDIKMWMIRESVAQIEQFVKDNLLQMPAAASATPIERQ